MNIQQLEQIDTYRWRLPRSMYEKRADVLLYGSEALLRTMDDKVLEQVRNIEVSVSRSLLAALWGQGRTSSRAAKPPKHAPLPLRATVQGVL